MKRILIPASGAVLATGLLAAGLAASAQAAPDVASDAMAKSAASAKAIAEFWADNNNAALKAATASNVWDNSDVTKLKSSGGYSADSKPGLIGTPVAKSSKVHNVNLPKTIGKVFFVNGKGEKKWCSATAIQSKYKNLVSTAGHCVYDVDRNTDVMSKWVFVPGYYQGKAPYGIYVGKQAFTHYDFDVYEDFDRDYAFVTVYNGIKIADGKKTQVTQAQYDAYKGEKDRTLTKIEKSEYDSLVSKYGAESSMLATKASKNDAQQVGNDYKPKSGETKFLAGVEVTKAEFATLKDVAKEALNGEPCVPGGVVCYDLAGNELNPNKVAISKAEYDALVAKKSQGGFDGELTAANGGWYKQQFYKKQWYVSVADTIDYFKATAFYIVPEATVSDAGRLSDNVGGQGFAWNQPTGKYIRVFGYPALAHPDGNKNFTGVTPKWCYGKTSAKVVQAPAKKIEEHVSIRCSMTEGADGGPWLYNYSNAKRIGYVNGVTSTFADQDGNNRIDTITSPYFDGETATVYRSAANVWSGKIVG
ncbi:trypsin-like serine peptidase [Nonomuraea soli]|uniref:Trypsin-like serine protease n=1 Tax=Nonomuraea soli TaxID=1032476 RepID=A0A7W0CNL9_9ACTN|nr:hypothetical protein [Nonomuraea soli]MBA2894245.1 hypothetical protein [Nonomuraea soli]